MIRTGLAVGAVVLVAIFAAADAVRNGAEPGEPEPVAAETGARAESGAAALRGAGLPPAGVLPGTLWFLTDGFCRLQRLRLDTLELSEEVPQRGCGLWVSPRGDLAVTGGATRGSGAGTIRLVRLDDADEPARPLGLARGDVRWSPDGERVAWCQPDGSSAVLVPRGNSPRLVAGCQPSFGADGSLLTTEERPLNPEVLRDGRVALSREHLRRGFPGGGSGRLDVLGFDESRSGLLAVAVFDDEDARIRPRLELWRGQNLEASFELPLFGDTGSFGRFGQVVEFSPDGSEVAVGFPDAGTRVAVYDVRSGAELLPPTRREGFSWSRDGTWFALSTGEEIVVFGAGRTSPAYVLPLPAGPIAWR
jgi:hypothetical protein